MTASGQPAPASIESLAAESVLEQVDVAVIVTDRDSTIVYFNAFAERLFGFAADKVVGCSVLDLGIAEEDHRQAIRLAQEVLRGGRWVGTFCNVCSDGSRIFTRVEAVPRHCAGERSDGNAGSTVDGIVIFAREALTESKEEYEDRLGLFDKLGGLLAESLGFNVTLRKVADILVPQFAEHCFIDLYDEDGVLRRHVLRHAPSCLPAADVWVGLHEQVDYAPGHFCREVLEQEQSVLVEDLRRRKVDRLGSRGDDLCAKAGVRSAVAAPLKARGVLLGVLTLARSEYGDRPGPCFDGDDHSLVSAIASRIAIAVDNARLFEEERETALGFQKGLLPRQLPSLDGLDTAHHYEPAEPLIDGGVQTQAGGDWYDLIPLSAGRVGIVIGDVEGHGARAAAIMGQLRAAVRAFAQFDLPPAELLKRLEEWVRAFDMTSSRHADEGPAVPRVSCLYLVYDAWSRQLWYANAGHDAPLLIDGGVGHLDVEPGQVLGENGTEGAPQLPQEQTCTLPRGGTLLLYTDGLTKRHPDVFAGDSLEALRDRVAEVAHADVDSLAAEALAAVPGGIDDDVAVLVLRSHERDLDVTECRLTSGPAEVAEARRTAVETFERWGIPDEQAHIACLLVSEVVTNAVRHAMATPSPRGATLDSFLGLETLMADGAGDPWESFPDLAGDAQPEGTEQDEGDDQELVLRLRRGESAVWAEVFDQDLRLPRIRVADEDDEGGRGLYLVERLSTRWGSRATRDGKWVWFEIAL